jgi:penicillin-binding protein 2
MLHQAGRPTQRSAPLSLPADYYTAIVEGMEQCVLTGSARYISQPRLRIPGLRIAGKTGTAQRSGNLTVGWFICFAPVEDPQIAIAVAVEGDTPGEDAGGGLIAAPVAHAILKKWWEKKTAPPAPRQAATGP